MAGSCPPEAKMRALLDVVLVALDIYTWVIIASAIFSWLYAFNVVNPRNQVVAAIGRVLYQLTEPALRPIRRFVPAFGGLDISPIILLLIVFLIQRIIAYYIYPYVF
jgi:YggT family protein